MTTETGSDLSQRIMRSARELFFARGFVNTQLRAIAIGAGTSESGVLRLYGSKNGLLRAVYASCWGEINDRVDKALAEAAETDPDSRNLLMELARTVWQGYQADPDMHIFLLGHFGFRETTGLSPDDSIDPAIGEGVKREYHRYLERIHDLCRQVVADRSELAGTGVNAVALGHALTAIVHGIQTSWYMASQEPEITQSPVSVEDGMAVMRLFLYPESGNAVRGYA